MRGVVQVLPNVITFGRLLAVPATIYAILIGRLDWAFWLFVAAGVSDAIDGAVARLCDARTVLGSFLDPLADKALLVSVYVTLTSIGVLPLGLVILVVSRDLMIVGAVILLYTLHRPTKARPLMISKINTAAQIVLAAAALATHGAVVAEPALLGLPLTDGLEIVVGITTIWSGLAYVIRLERWFGGDDAGGNTAHTGGFARPRGG